LLSDRPPTGTRSPGTITLGTLDSRTRDTTKAGSPGDRGLACGGSAGAVISHTCPRRAAVGAALVGVRAGAVERCRRGAIRGALGAVAYLVLIACALARRAGGSRGDRGAILGAAVWFIGCSCSHPCPLPVLHGGACDRHRGRVVGLVTTMRGTHRVARPGGAWLADRRCGLLIGAQAAFSSCVPVAAPAGARKLRFGTGADRIVGVLDGSLRLHPRMSPCSAPGGPAHPGGLFDYACPHCRRTHEYVTEAVRRCGEVALVALPCPSTPRATRTSTRPRRVSSTRANLRGSPWPSGG